MRTPVTTHTPTASRPHPVAESGVQHVYTFSNGYGASVVSHEFSYGGKYGAWEVAVVEMGEDENPYNFDLTYKTPITDDVLGYLTDEEVHTTLTRIAALPRRFAYSRKGN